MSDGAYIWHSTGAGMGYYDNGSCTFDRNCIPITGPGFYGPYVTPGSTRTEEHE